MARLRVDDEDVVVRLSPREALLARRREIRVPLAQVKDARVEPDWWRALRGTARSGHSTPDRYSVGERQHPQGRDFVAVRVGRPAVVVDLCPSTPFVRLAVSAPDAERVARTLRNRVGAPR
ncbi:hypothetical protein [Streptomyces sp. TRM68367]|uniref:hypothetical protein n=1 Tax=Streptomyces sp. TRM68367 TaxID=2758415 RepID=UPI00165B5588|nr:hypothetical protein [Streptomyces sp. TRM68367]MBC9727952.1 hypothetical protein [Streptomyces sp. TRM68367]